MPEDYQGQQSPEGWAPRPRDDTDEAFRLGARFDLGGLLETAWTGESGTLSSCGGLLAWAAAIGGLIAWFSTPQTQTAAIAVIAPAGTLFLLGLLLRRLGLPGSIVRRRLYWYSDGVIELVHDQPEPRVVRWADVETVSISYSEGDDDTPPAPVGCILRERAGTELADLGRYPEWVLRPAADRDLRIRRAGHRRRGVYRPGGHHR